MATSNYEGTTSFKIHVRVVGDPNSEFVLEADVFDRDDAVSQSVAYAYDPFDLLVRRTADEDGVGPNAASDQFFSWLGNQVNLQFGGSEAADLSHRDLWNPAAVDQILADESVSSLASHGNVLYPLTDHLGSTSDLATYDSGTATTTVENHRVFDSYGNLVSATGTSTLAFGFTGAYFDRLTDLQYNRARWYDPGTGRWMSEDPIGFNGGDTNLSRYVHNSPTNARDPLGLYDFWEFADDALGFVEVPATFLTGVGDSFSMGITKIAREGMWGKEAAEIHYKGVYKAGEWTEVAVEIGVTGGGALLKKAAAKQIAKEAAEIAAREVGEEITEQAAKRAVAAAKAKIAGELRREARQIAGATEDEIVHHVNTLIGHPPFPGRGPVPSEFPTVGIQWFANSKFNLMNIAKNDPGRHVWLHQRAYMAEQLVVTLSDPVLTSTRTLLNLQRDFDMDVDVHIDCKR